MNKVTEELEGIQQQIVNALQVKPVLVPEMTKLFISLQCFIITRERSRATHKFTLLKKLIKFDIILFDVHKIYVSRNSLSSLNNAFFLQFIWYIVKSI